jgi:flagellar protein FliO/FliZ
MAAAWSGAGVVSAAATGVAAEAAPPASLTPGLIQATLGLALVLAVIWAAAWLLRRIAPVGASSRSPIKLIATQAVGQRERVVLVEVADQWLLLGVAPGQVTALQTLPKSSLPESEPRGPLAPQFSRLLALAKGKRQ